MIDNKVKLVIWDLDDTFWRGTLSEEDIVPIQSNIDIVLELSRRGIVNSICSKNELSRAKAKLEELNIYDHFIFPVITFSPKGKAVAQIIEDAALRAENVLFIDDNQLNLEEVKYFNSGIMVGHPDDLLSEILTHPNLAGKPDPELTRLKQYQFLQKKVEQRSATTLSNEDFLRSSNIRVSIDIAVEENIDRVIDLINRSNQLNYTKFRLETSKAVRQFKNMLNSFGYPAGCVKVVDNYGDYGIVGFFLMNRRAGVKRLIHFVFSCRAMHMGIEQYVYEMLGRPDIDICQPVTYGLDYYSKIDWINSGGPSQGAAALPTDKKLLLVGGCDLLQLASFCSSNRIEFVNKMQDGMKVRYDDPGFIMGDREAIRSSTSIREVPLWTYEDAVEFDEAAASSEIILISMWPALKGKYFRTNDGVLVHFSRELFKKLRSSYKNWLKHVEKISIGQNERLDLIMQSLCTLEKKNRVGAKVFLLGCYTKHRSKDSSRDERVAYNDAARKFCRVNPAKFQYVDIDAIVPQSALVDGAHFSREGYFLLAQYILEQARQSGDAQPHRDAA